MAVRRVRGMLAAGGARGGLRFGAGLGRRERPQLLAAAGIGPQFGYFFPAGRMQGYVNLKGYYEFAAENRPEGWNV